MVLSTILTTRVSLPCSSSTSHAATKIDVAVIVIGCDNDTCVTVSDRGARNHCGKRLDVRLLLSVALSTMQVAKNIQMCCLSRRRDMMYDVVFCSFEERKRNEQKINLKFCFKFGKTPKETYAMLVRVYEDQALLMKCVYEWFARFRDGRERVSDNSRR
ncbi:hypothetical protein TNCV_3873611 [Trichonephila clavipes]|nr:hypothetical protein TNCV_3873611 [Trichonephila clavipes]